jgi:hypothetical protein
MVTQAQEDGYVECSECGHPVEQHDVDGCDVCQTGGTNCPTKWTKAQIRDLRRREGLPAGSDISAIGW